MNFSGIKKRIPIVMGRDEFDNKIRQAVDQAVAEARSWNVVASTDPKVQSGSRDVFSSLGHNDPFDRSPLYTPERGNWVIPDHEVYLRPNLKLADKIKQGLSAVMEAVTGGWVSIGSGRGILSGRDISPEHLFLAQDAAVIKTRSDPHCSGIVKNIQYYTIGKGVPWSSPSPEVSSWLLDFRRANRVEERERNMVREIFQEGEYFWVYFVDPETGRIKIRKFRPKEVVEIETATEDIETRLSYHRMADFLEKSQRDQWYADINYENQLKNFAGETSSHELVPNTYIQFSKYGASDDVRGWPPLYACLRYLKYLEDFIVDRARLHHEQAKVVWFQQRKGTASRAGGNRSGQLNPLIAPKGGSMWIEDDSVSYRPNYPDLNSADAEHDALLLIYAISSNVCVPMHVWNQRSDQQVYASIRKADTPFSQSITANQTFHSEEWEERDKFVVRKAVEAGSLPEKVRIVRHEEDLVIQALRRINEMVCDSKSEEEIISEAKAILAPGMKRVNVPTLEVPVTRTFPDVVQEAPLDMAKTMLIHQKMGIVSDATLATRAGYDWHEELLRMVQESKQKAAMSAMEEAERLQQRKKYGLPIEQPQDKSSPDDRNRGADDVPGTPGGGRGPGAGAGGTKVSRDNPTDSNSGTNPEPKKTE